MIRPLTINKKGQADFVSLFFVLVVLFGTAVFFVILYSAYNENIKDNLNDALTSSTPVDANANVTAILEQTSGGLKTINGMFPLLLVGLFAFGLIIALMGKSHPVFFFIGILILGIAIILAVVFSNSYESITSTGTFADAAEDFGILDIIMNNLPLTIFILFCAISAILYAMRSSGSPAGGGY